MGVINLDPHLTFMGLEGDLEMAEEKDARAERTTQDRGLRIRVEQTGTRSKSCAGRRRKKELELTGKRPGMVKNSR